MKTLRRTTVALVLLGLNALLATRGYASDPTTQGECNQYCHGQCDGICAANDTTCNYYISDWDGANCGCSGTCHS